MRFMTLAYPWNCIQIFQYEPGSAATKTPQLQKLDVKICIWFILTLLYEKLTMDCTLSATIATSFKDIYAPFNPSWTDYIRKKTHQHHYHHLGQRTRSRIHDHLSYSWTHRPHIQKSEAKTCCFAFCLFFFRRVLLDFKLEWFLRGVDAEASKTIPADQSLLSSGLFRIFEEVQIPLLW